MAAVLVFLGLVPVLNGYGIVSREWVIAAVGGGGLIAVVGFLEDCKGVSVLWRLSVHFIAAVWMVYWLGGVPEALAGDFAVPDWVVALVLCVGSVWAINLYNFMDGIDGIASIEAITVCAGGIVLYMVDENQNVLWVPPALLLAAVVGFLPWNYPRARIFMGDSGSGFLGFIFALFCLQAAWFDEKMVWAWLILLGVFVVDTSVTILRRLLRKRNLCVPHRSHAYQFASRRFKSHAIVSLVVGGINASWLLSIAFLVVSDYLQGWSALVIAYAPLVGLALHFNAGAEELQERGLIK